MNPVQLNSKAEKRSRNDWETPDDLFSSRDALNRFELDVCASSRNAKVPRYFDRETDGLKQRWIRTWWCNPPFRTARDLVPWVEKAHSETFSHPFIHGELLMPANRTEQPFWHELVVPSIEYGICRIVWIQRRLKFKGAPSSAPFPCLLLHWGRSP